MTTDHMHIKGVDDFILRSREATSLRDIIGTPEEMAARHAEYRRLEDLRWAESKRVAQAVAKRFDVISEPVVRSIAALHAPNYSGCCSTCDAGDEPIEWPCSTIDLIAEAYDIDTTWSAP